MTTVKRRAARRRREARGLRAGSERGAERGTATDRGPRCAAAPARSRRRRRRSRSLTGARTWRPRDRRRPGPFLPDGGRSGRRSRTRTRRGGRRATRRSRAVGAGVWRPRRGEGRRPARGPRTGMPGGRWPALGRDRRHVGRGPERKRGRRWWTPARPWTPTRRPARPRRGPRRAGARDAPRPGGRREGRHAREGQRESEGSLHGGHCHTPARGPQPAPGRTGALQAVSSRRAPDLLGSTPCPAT